jgi:hypothetical protein
MNALNKAMFLHDYLSGVMDIICLQLIILTVQFASTAICRNIVRHKEINVSYFFSRLLYFKVEPFVNLSLANLGFTD